MKTGIIGLPQVGKTALFRILTKAPLADAGYGNPREAHVGVAKVPDDRLDRLAAQYNPKKLTHASVEYVDVGAQCVRRWAIPLSRGDCQSANIDGKLLIE